jgi:hypothetical protein
LMRLPLAIVAIVVFSLPGEVNSTTFSSFICTDPCGRFACVFVPCFPSIVALVFAFVRSLVVCACLLPREARRFTHPSKTSWAEATWTCASHRNRTTCHLVQISFPLGKQKVPSEVFPTCCLTVTSHIPEIYISTKQHTRRTRQENWTKIQTGFGAINDMHANNNFRVSFQFHFIAHQCGRTGNE